MNLSKMDQSQIQSIENQTISVTWSQAGEKSFNLRGTFIPDVIQVQACVSVRTVDVDNTYTDPVLGEVAGIASTVEYANNIFEVQSNILPTDTLCVCNFGNTFNPVYTHWNGQRQTIQGSYTINVYNTNGQAQFVNGSVVLHFTFIRYKDK